MEKIIQFPHQDKPLDQDSFQVTMNGNTVMKLFVIWRNINAPEDFNVCECLKVLLLAFEEASDNNFCCPEKFELVTMDENHIEIELI